jgi:hypothetical protein
MNKVEFAEKLIERVLNAANATLLENDRFMNATLSVIAKLR